MLAFILGCLLFALGIGVSLALHEAGHLLTAKWFGMKVRRYYVGFGPRIWSFRRGETEYGIKALPIGGFCEIAGMTTLDEVTPDESPRAMWRYKVWKRTVVMAAGAFVHFIFGFLVLYLMAVTMGLPNIGNEPVVRSADKCAVSSDRVSLEQLPCGPNDPAPARDAGMRPGDVIVAIDGTEINTWTQVREELADKRGNTPVVVERGDRELTLTVNVVPVQRPAPDAVPGNQDNEVVMAGALGATQQSMFEYGPIAGIGGATEFTGTMFVNVYEGLKRFPERIPKVVEAIFGGERAPDTPVSVVGASIIGGDAVEQGLWEVFLLLLVMFNFFIGVFNLLPLLPMDGGHIAVLWYERVRDWIRRLRGLGPRGPADYTKLTGVTLVLIAIGGSIMLLTVTADIVNPIRLE
ncbi:RIP metalloprotease RseP [Tamaricihabitans halophyticus]|uniref:RIP metalloprotease RseP n=1 Tax=Tamaricihabitans halophyticus TaxID=1262583 RepID=A0A4R2QQE2_9PSEU|nr:site-2 protease family protein [Tamaricihabitans halophyticus]TCP51940.1 RIP metalloprotease RseP [Tamaricihabitans halophyticus]